MRFRPLFVTLLGLFLSAGFVSAQAETFGRTTVGTIASGELRPDNKRGSKFTLSENGTATELCAWLDGGPGPTGTPQQPVRFVLYRDSNGVPGAKLAETPQVTLWAGYPAQWICQEIGWTPLTAGAYWLVIHTGSNGSQSNGPVRYFYDGAANWYGNADTYADGASNPFGAGSAGSGTVSIYAVYTPASRLQNAGRTTVGNTPSAPLRGDFKRGSSVTFSQAGRVTALTAYFDTVNTGVYYAYQSIRLALYEDVNGVPGPLVAESMERTLQAGTLGRWVTFPTPDAQVHAGKYWLMVHTSAVSTNDTSGSVVGGARYFADGTAGNWFGNADAFNDGASSTFGTAGAGNGTLSAFASYEPGVFTSSRLGYTKVGIHAQGWAGGTGIGTAYLQGYKYRLVASGAKLNGFYAYLDSVGTPSQTQQVRMAVFDHYPDWDIPMSPIAVSNVVTIQGGRAPGWVKFDLPTTPLAPGYYWIAIHTGPSSPIIRNYVDDVGGGYENGEDDFADGPTSFFNTDAELSGFSGTASAYATYTTN